MRSRNATGSFQLFQRLSFMAGLLSAPLLGMPTDTDQMLQIRNNSRHDVTFMIRRNDPVPPHGGTPGTVYFTRDDQAQVRPTLTKPNDHLVIPHKTTYYMQISNRSGVCLWNTTFTIGNGVGRTWVRLGPKSAKVVCTTGTPNPRVRVNTASFNGGPAPFITIEEGEGPGSSKPR